MNLERVNGIETSSVSLKASALPLSYTCTPEKHGGGLDSEPAYSLTDLQSLLPLTTGHPLHRTRCILIFRETSNLQNF